MLERDGNGWKATGVVFVHKDKEHTVKVDGEVILSAGSVQSPQLLELSGVGNPEVLKAAGIPTKVANPNVGENLQEHMSKLIRYWFTAFLYYADLHGSVNDDL